MGKTKLAQYTVYLEQAVAAKFEKLAATTRIAKATLLREAVDDLLYKHKAPKRPK
jgi:predicted transcriptional regulator